MNHCNFKLRKPMLLTKLCQIPVEKDAHTINPKELANIRTVSSKRAVVSVDHHIDFLGMPYVPILLS